MKIKDKISFQSQGFYNLTGQIQENTLLNRGLLDVGGLAIPQMIMSNNKDERIERGTMSAIYFVSSFLAPYVLLPLFNKHFLKTNGIVKDFSTCERRIIEVSKKYLTGDMDFVKGIRDTAKALELEAKKKGQKISVIKDFENILEKFKGKKKEEELKNKLLNAHEGILFSDFLATSLMWCATPWIVMEMTKLRTKRSGFSATYGIVDEKQSKLNAEKHEKEKKKNLLISALLGIIPAIIFPKLVTKGFKDKSGILSSIVKKIPENFNYTKGIFPSKLIFAAIWLLADYPTGIISARDKYERRDRAIRWGANVLVFFCGDAVLNNVFGQLSDRYLGTDIMDKTNFPKGTGFFKKLLMHPKSFPEIETLKNTGIKPELLAKTKNVGAGLYWLTLFANMALLGFAVPKFLNTILKRDLSKQNALPQQSFEPPNQREVFEKFKRTN
ncbi:MAG: hypothetical protein PHC64_06250 [Candidatus Gastranaerophilales bacterium]|nr:hypothetical protein [Candidatus Gastranaerophilales bacterium]